MNKTSALPSEIVTQAWTDLEASGSTLGLTDFVTFRLTVTLNVLHSNLTRQYFNESSPVSLPGWRLLGLLHHHGTVSTGTIAKLSLMDKALISRTVATLVEQGFAARLKDPSHATRQMLEMTDSGREVFLSILHQAQPLHAKLLMSLTAKERETFNTVLGKLMAASSQV